MKMEVIEGFGELGVEGISPKNMYFAKKKKEEKAQQTCLFENYFYFWSALTYKVVLNSLLISTSVY